MKITTKMRQFAVSNLAVAADATDDQVQSALLTAIASKALTGDKLTELATEESVDEKIGRAVGAATAPLLEAMKAFRPAAPAVAVVDAVPATVSTPAGTAAGADAEDVFLKAAKSAGVSTYGVGDGVRVKRASEFYDGTKSRLVSNRFSMNGQDEPVKQFTNSGLGNIEKQYDTTSKREWAMIGAWAKYMLRGMNLPGWHMTEHEVQLCLETIHEHDFVGHADKADDTCGQRRLKDYQIDSHKNRLNSGLWTKTILEDSTSGGEHAVPTWWDDAIIMVPLLHSELFPWVQVINVPRGSHVDGFAIGQPTFVSTASGSAITPFSTTAFITAFDTVIYPATCAIEWGNDFYQDTLPGFGQAITHQIGEEAKRWLDEQIAIGDGTTEPQGIFVATNSNVPGVGTHTFSSITYNDIANLAFGINKAGRNAFGGTATRFVMNDVQYRNAMEIVTGVTGDTRPIFGMNLRGYMLGDYPVAIQNNISNGNMALCNLRGYRMYRRQGLEFENVTGGRTLALSNSSMLVARMRWGGKMTIPTSFTAEMTL